MKLAFYLHKKVIRHQIRVRNLFPYFKFYRPFVYDIGALPTLKGKSIGKKHLSTNQKKDYQITRMDNFRYPTRYFTDSGVIGSKKFVKENYQLKKNEQPRRNEKRNLQL
jgi:putative transposase